MPTAHFPYCATPKGLANTVGAAHTRAFATWQGCRETSCTLTTERCRLQPVKAKLRGCFASLDRFPAPSASVSFATPHGDGEGSRATKSCILPLTPWNRPNTHRRGRWIGFATCPCGLASESGVWGKAPRACFLFLKLLGGCNRSKKVKKMCIFRIFATKNTANLANFDPTPTLTGGE